MAAEKFSRLTAFTDNITIIAREVSDELQSLIESVMSSSDCCRVRVIEKDFNTDDTDYLTDADFVIAATDDKKINAEAAKLCRKMHIPVNCVDDPENCDFVFPAIIKKGDLTVSISTDGTSPAYARKLKQQISDIIPENIDSILDQMARLRRVLPVEQPQLSQHERSIVYKERLDQMLQGENTKRIIIASRGSRLSQTQDDIVDRQLKKCGCSSERIVISTKGDQDRKSALKDIGGSGLFVREIEKALAENRADAAVHSAKDLPYELSEGMVIGAVMKAADPADYLVIRTGHEDNIRVIGTGSARRASAVKMLYPGVCVRNLRGNVETRLRKLNEEDMDAIVIAKAGIDRLGIDLSGYTVHRLTPEQMVPACGQGIIAVECRSDDADTLEILKLINDRETYRRFQVERYLFELMKADCSLAVGVHAVVTGDELTVYALFDGRQTIKHGKYDDYRQICQEAADQIYH